ncbi:MAG: ABC transporter ATP-binding protein [Anaerolineales bacterium]
MMNKEPIIYTNNLTRSFGDILAVDRISLSINPGEVFGFLGPNGAGKTTTIRMLAALLEPTSGEAYVSGFQVGKNNQKIRHRIGLLPEAPGLYAALTAEQNLVFYGTMYGVEEISHQIKRYLELLGLWNRRFEPVATFSKGMRQKLAIARALLHEPEILFLDEPTSGLDPQAARLVREFIEDLKGEGRTIILCTHNLEEADRLCDRVAVVNGHLLALDSPKILRRNIFGRKVVVHLAEIKPEFEQSLGSFEFVTEVQVVENKIIISVENPETNNPALIRALVEEGAEILFVGELRRRLEDVYLELMKSSQGSNNGKN